MRTFLLLLTACVVASAQQPPDHDPCTNCPPVYTVNALTNDPALHYDATRRAQNYGTEHWMTGWQWEFSPNTNQIFIYDAAGNVLTTLTEPNGSGHMGIRAAWDYQPHASNVIVGVIDNDTGSKHGQRVSSQIAQPGGDGTNTTGVARHVQLRQKTSGGDTVVSNRIWELVQEGAKVINLSFGWSGRIYPEKTVAAMRDNPGVIFTVAGANSNWDIDNPANYDALCQCQLPNVLCIGSSTKADEKMNPGIWGTNVFGFAPGRRVLVELFPWTPSNAVLEASFADEELPDMRNPPLYYGSGSSFSVAKVAGGAALLVEHFKGETTAQIIERLAMGCEVPPALAGLSRFGRVNLHRSFIWTRVPRVTIDVGHIYAAAGAGQTATVSVSTNLVDWSFHSTITGDGWPHVIASVSTTNVSKFYKIQ